MQRLAETIKEFDSHAMPADAKESEIGIGNRTIPESDNRLPDKEKALEGQCFTVWKSLELAVCSVFGLDAEPSLE